MFLCLFFYKCLEPQVCKALLQFSPHFNILLTVVLIGKSRTFLRLCGKLDVVPLSCFCKWTLLLGCSGLDECNLCAGRTLWETGLLLLSLSLFGKAGSTAEFPRITVHLVNASQDPSPMKVCEIKT